MNHHTRYFLGFERMNEQMREYDIVHDLSSFHIAILLVGDDKREDEFNSIGKNFGDYFVYDIAEDYGPEFFQGIHRDSFGYQSQKGGVKRFE